MLDPIISFFTGIFYWLGRAIGKLIAWVLLPFVAASKWYTHRGWMVRVLVGLLVLGWLSLYLNFFWQSQRWSGFDPDYVVAFDFKSVTSEPGEPIKGAENTCGKSGIVEASIYLIDFNVNQNTWIPSMLVSKMGFFGLDWKRTPFFDNKEAFQRGINQVLRRTSLELVDSLGRVRGTSRIDPNLQSAREELSYREDAWYFSLDPIGPLTPSPSRFRLAIRDMGKFNEDLGKCKATYDARADNLQKFLDRIASDIGSTSDILRGRMEESDAGWFDTRADDRFWFSYGQLYAYYGILSGARSDFKGVFRERNLIRIWERTEQQLRAALDIQPLIISNGGEASWIMPSHLATMGFYLLRVRANLTEMRDVLKT